MLIKVLIKLAILLLCVNARCGYCNLIWDWNFNDPVQNVVSGEPVYQFATIYNSALSDENITISKTQAASMGWSSPDPNYLSYYDWQSGTGEPGLFGEPFDSMILAPGESLIFTFGRFIPLINQAPINFQMNGTGRIKIGGIEKSDDFSFTVTEQGSTPVPEPATMLLLASGLVGLTGLRRKFR